MVDVDYNALTLEAGEPVRFNLALWDKTKSKPIDLTGIWARIAPQGSYGVVFAGQLGIPEFGAPGMTYAFPKAGGYELTVRFQHKDQTLAEAVFPLVVESVAASSENTRNLPSRNTLLAASAGVASGFALALALLKKKKL